MFDGSGGSLVFAFVTLGLLMAIVAVITGRRLPDEAATRPRAIYLAVAMLPALVIGVLAATAFVEAAVQLILGPERGEDLLGGLGGLANGGLSGAGAGLGDLLTGLGDFGLDPKDAAIRTLVGAGITAVVAFALFRLHQDWRQPVIDGAGFLGSPAARVLQAFAYTVVLIFVVLFALGAVKAGYGIFRVVAPGTSAFIALSETAEREGGIADIVSGLALAGASWWLFQLHWRLAATWRGDATVAPTVPEPPPSSAR
jgi:hypothetical protein